MTEKHPEALVVEAPAMDKVKIPCTMGKACKYTTPEVGIEYAMQLLDKHLLEVHEQVLPAETKGPGVAPVKVEEEYEVYENTIR